MNKYANTYLKSLFEFLNKPKDKQEQVSPEAYEKTFLDSWPEPITDINNSEYTWYKSKDDSTLKNISNIYSEMMARKPHKAFIEDPQYFTEMIVNPYSKFTEEYNQNNSNKLNDGYKVRDLRGMNPKQWALFSQYMSQVDPESFAL